MHTDSLPPQDPTVFLLVRHAQTIWNREQRHTGSTEIALSASAAGQISRLTRRLSREPISAIYSSPLSRCQLTIKPTAQILGLPIHTSNDLIERNLGDWEGRSPLELLPTHPGYEFPKSAYTGEFRIPGAETIEELEHRIRHFLTTTHHKHPGKVVAVSTHSGVIWTVLHRIVNNPPEEFFWPTNCSVSTLSSNGNHFSFTSFQDGR